MRLEQNTTEPLSGLVIEVLLLLMVVVVVVVVLVVITAVLSAHTQDKHRKRPLSAIHYLFMR